MTRRDLAWRAAGAALLALGCSASAFTGTTGAGPGLALLAFGGSILGLVLLVQGRRVPVAFRIERSRHRELALAIRMRRRAARDRS